MQPLFIYSFIKFYLDKNGLLPDFRHSYAEILHLQNLGLTCRKIHSRLLRRLSIQNYAIIDELEIEFSKQLNILTGETGAGKSIIMGALGLILGERAESSALLNKEKKSVVEAVFITDKKEINTFLSANDLDSADELVIRREINTGGKSRAFINDTPVTLLQLGLLGHLLVDLHQQFDTLELSQNEFQLQVLDALAGNSSLLDSYQKIFNNRTMLKKELEVLKLQKQQADKEADYNRFQFDELEDAAFKENELEDTEASLSLLQNAEDIKSALDTVQHQLADSETPLVQQLKILSNQLTPFAGLHSQLPEIIQRLQAAQVELKDVAGDIARLAENIQYDPQQITLMNERLAIGYKLQKKHGVKTTAELLQIKKELEEKLQNLQATDENILAKEKACTRLEQEINQAALKISERRKKQIKPLEEQVNKLLKQVGMPNAKLQVSCTDAPPGPAGADAVEFLFDANKSGKFLPVSKVASGGELSRLMLCIKSLIAQSVDLPTMIFDEIDTGISGEAARQVGIIMKELSASRQVICITHQPQIAGKADAHLFVYKEIKNDKVKTGVRLLNREERITAIAQMLSGEKPTAAALQNAREMVMN